MTMFKKTVALLACAVLATSGCASAVGQARTFALQAHPLDRTVLADYVQRLPPGSRVRVEQIDGRQFRGTLMSAGPQSIIVQRNTRIPEAPVTLPMDQLARVTVDSAGGSIAKAVGIGAAAGAAASLGVFLLLLMAFDD
jgi:hypothetical protein